MLAASDHDGKEAFSAHLEEGGLKGEGASMAKRKQDSKGKPERERQRAKAKVGEKDLEPKKGNSGAVKGGARMWSDGRLKHSVREL
jgi:hypothetical protein